MTAKLDKIKELVRWESIPSFEREKEGVKRHLPANVGLRLTPRKGATYDH